MKKEKKIETDYRKMTGDERLKYEIAEELGLIDRVKESGWKSLSAKETGKIGGLIRKKHAEKALKLKEEK